jgi:DNA-binding transcriptional ArsR family regulator
MSGDPNLAALAALLAEPSRAAVLTSLLDGRSWTATELAAQVKIAPSTLSAHLKKLSDAQLIRVLPLGRHRYFQLASDAVAQMLEQLALFAPPTALRTPGAKRASVALRRCRLCYDHLAGQVGVALTDAMLQHQWLVEAMPWFDLTDLGRHALNTFDLGVARGKTCMDWSERRLHLAGALGQTLTSQMLQRRWLMRQAKDRALMVTPIGSEALSALFGVTI